MRNLVLITIDCLRADADTPELNKLGGLRFTNAISASAQTPSSFSAMLSGWLPLDCGGRLKLNRSPRVGIAERLKNQGYHTAGFHSNPWLSRVHGWDIGFDTYKDVAYKGRLYALAEEVDKAVKKWLRKAKQPFFLWVHYMDCHEPYRLENMPERIEGKREAYREAVATTDKHVVGLIEQLPSDTAIIVTADHGQAFMEHGMHGHSHSLYEELIHVPLVLIKGSTYNLEEQRITSLLNIPTMLLWEAGVVDDSHSYRLGVAYSQLADWQDRDKLITGKLPRMSSLRTDTHKLITCEGKWPYFERDEVELYDLENDPEEKVNLWINTS